MLSFQQLTQLNCVIAMENILTRANYFNLSDPTVVLYWRAGGGLEISNRNWGIPSLIQALKKHLTLFACLLSVLLPTYQ